MRWAWFAALLGMIGAIAFRYGVLPRLDRDPLLRPVAARAEAAVWFVALGAAALSVAALFARLWMQVAALGGGDAAWDGARMEVLLRSTGWGLAWVLQAIATLAFVTGLFIAKAPHGRGVGWMGAGAGAVLLSAVPALSGHAASVGRLNGIASGHSDPARREELSAFVRSMVEADPTTPIDGSMELMVAAAETA